MKSNVKVKYDVVVYPYENHPEESIGFSLYPQKVADHSVQFDISFGKDRYDSKYIGYHDDRIWFIDPANCRGLFINTPLNISATSEDLFDIYEYDEDECMAIAKSIELICIDFLNYDNDFRIL